MTTFKLAHFSDIHFFTPCKSLRQFFNRRFLGNFNYLFNRRNHFDQSQAEAHIDSLKQRGVSSLLITGDFTCTASTAEFSQAKLFLYKLKEAGFSVYVLPGNHDVYTKYAHLEKTFYQALGDLINFQGDYSLNLVNDSVVGYQLPYNAHLVLIDASKFNRSINANGHFSPLLEKNIQRLLQEIPSDGSIILAAHFPYDLFRHPRAHMIDGEKLEALIKSDLRIKLYLHGHRHLPRIEKNETHLVIDSGSISLKHRSSYSLIEFDGAHFSTTITYQNQREYVKENIYR